MVGGDQTLHQCAINVSGSALKTPHDFHPKKYIFYISSVSSEVSTTRASDAVNIFTTAKGIFKCIMKINIASIVLYLNAYTAATLIDILMLTPSLTVTQSPVIVGGVNVTAVVAILVVLVLLLVIGVVVVVGLSYYLCYHKIQGLKLT